MEAANLTSFRTDIELLGRELRAGQGERDLAHFRKILLWNRLLLVVGLVTLGLFPNPITVLCLSLATFSRWTMIGHHVSHGGYDRLDASGRYHRARFAMGSLPRRALDWLDWMLPEAWNLEHNKHHHYSLNEPDDPDLVEDNLRSLRESSAPLPVKYLTVLFFMLTWKWFYYSPNTLSRLQLDRARKGEGAGAEGAGSTYQTLLSALLDPPAWLQRSELVLRVLGPYFLYQFVLLPLPFLLLSGAAYRNALLNLLLAELLTNMHAFLVVVTNHAGEDLYRFDTKCTKDVFLLRQVIGSANYHTSGDVNDFLHGFLNYQIEHHLWPDLSMLSYQRGQERVKGICRKYNVPYVQESVWRRLVKTVDIMVGRKGMRRFPERKAGSGV
uniref:Fatty acid desaturase domain-containing protein n=1 Tax=Arcella intermedia TaxID=1963864 RepID=A0A6B2L6L9_9EUKA